MEDLEGRIIKFGVGIGYSLAAAIDAKTQAKQVGRAESNVVTNYNFPPETIETPDETNAHNYLFVRGIVERSPDPVEREAGLIAHGKLLLDPRTGLCNKLGYHVAIEELKQKGVSTGYFIYMDGNNMKSHNDRQGELKVDKLLSTIGKTITSHVRTLNGKKPGKRQHETYHDVVAHRVNDSGGDEFLIFLNLEHNETNDRLVEDRARLILDSVYTAQKEFLREQDQYMAA